MHTKIPKVFIFLDRYIDNIFSNINIPVGIIYRNNKEKNHSKNLDTISLACRKKNIPFFIANNLILTTKYKADGIYISAHNKSIQKFLCFNKKNLIVIGGAHNYKEISTKINQGCQRIFLSPIFFTKDYKNKLDIVKFNLLTKNYDVKFVALGGIEFNNLKKIKLVNCYGFAGISFAQKKTGLLYRPVFINNLFD